ncbi:MAG: heme peroxidase, partial [Actinomycetota bacterium]|nr:heme peroxidase [Actinomycetota bacterium]
MEKHGSESYFVLGEGLLGESDGGRETARALTADEAATPPFRFSRLGPNGIGKQIPDAARKKLANAMVVGGGGQSGVPAGFTYLGQFVDHDLTFDKTSVMLGTNVPPATLLQARSPALDLDSLYGAGPLDAGSARFYRPDKLRLRVGKTSAEGEGLPSKPGFDLPRGEGSTVRAKRRAIIPD